MMTRAYGDVALLGVADLTGTSTAQITVDDLYAYTAPATPSSVNLRLIPPSIVYGKGFRFKATAVPVVFIGGIYAGDTDTPPPDIYDAGDTATPPTDLNDPEAGLATIIPLTLRVEAVAVNPFGAGAGQTPITPAVLRVRPGVAVPVPRTQVTQISESFNKADGVLGPDQTWLHYLHSPTPSVLAVAGNQVQMPGIAVAEEDGQYPATYLDNNNQLAPCAVLWPTSHRPGDGGGGTQPPTNDRSDMAAPHDTRNDPPEVILMAGLADPTDGISNYITGQERQGQREMVASTVIPRELLYCTEDDLTALGFTLGDPTDDLFREATLPEGWRREGSDHAMWSYIVDEHGRERAAVFYKAAFYDRTAHISITSLNGYIATCAYPDAPKSVVYDDEWATPAAVAEAAGIAAEAQERRAEDMRGYYPQGVPDALRTAERLRAIEAEARAAIE